MEQNRCSEAGSVLNHRSFHENTPASSPLAELGPDVSQSICSLNQTDCHKAELQPMETRHETKKQKQTKYEQLKRVRFHL